MLRPRPRAKGAAPRICLSLLPRASSPACWEMLIRGRTASWSQPPASSRPKQPPLEIVNRKRPSEISAKKTSSPWRHRQGGDLSAAATAAFKKVTTPQITDCLTRPTVTSWIHCARLAERGHGRARILIKAGFNPETRPRHSAARKCRPLVGTTTRDKHMNSPVSNDSNPRRLNGDALPLRFRQPSRSPSLKCPWRGNVSRGIL